MKRLFILGLVLLFAAGCHSGGSSKNDGADNQTQDTPTLNLIEVNPESLALPPGESSALYAWGNYSDGTRVEITDEVAWEVVDPQLGEIIHEPGSCRINALQSGHTEIHAILNGITGVIDLTISETVPPPPILTGIVVEPQSGELPVGFTKDFRALGHYSDGSSRDITTMVLWTSSNENVVSVVPDIAGRLSGLEVGSAEITAGLGGVSGSATLDVTPALLMELSITPDSQSLPVGITDLFKAEGVFSDGSIHDLTPEVAWNSSNPEVATIVDGTEFAGQVTPLSSGVTSISATLDAFEDTASLTVTDAILEDLYISPDEAVLPQGLTNQQFKVWGLYSDGETRDLTELAEWVSSAPQVAAVSEYHDSQGQVLTLIPGEAVLTAFFEEMEASAHITVTSATPVELIPDPLELICLPEEAISFEVWCRFSDGVIANVTELIQMSVLDGTLAEILRSVDEIVLQSTGTVGNTELEMAWGGLTIHVPVTVEPASTE